MRLVRTSSRVSSSFKDQKVKLQKHSLPQCKPSKTHTEQQSKSRNFPQLHMSGVRFFCRCSFRSSSRIQPPQVKQQKLRRSSTYILIFVVQIQGVNYTFLRIYHDFLKHFRVNYAHICDNIFPLAHFYYFSLNVTSKNYFSYLEVR